MDDTDPQQMKKRRGMWSRIGVTLVAILILGIVAHRLWSDYQTRFYHGTPITSLDEVTRISGVVFPDRIDEFEAHSWYDSLFVIARVRFSRADLDGFLAQKASRGYSASKRVDGTLKDVLDTKDEIDHDIIGNDHCERPIGEEPIITRWKVDSIRRYLIGSEIRMPNAKESTRLAVSLEIDLDDPKTVTVYVVYDDRGGILC
jgi:hypothetical protein